MFASYVSYEFGNDKKETYNNSSNGEYVALDELFDNSNMDFMFNNWELLFVPSELDNPLQEV